MVNRPCASVVRWRDTCVSSEVAWTVAPAIGWLSGPVTVPVMISVVEPTWAVAGRGATSATRRRIQLRGRRAATRECRREGAQRYTRLVGAALMRWGRVRNGTTGSRLAPPVRGFLALP